MKLRLKFILKNPSLPTDYRRIFMSFIKKLVSEPEDGKFFGQICNAANTRPFTFAVNLPQPKFENGKILLCKNELILTISTGDKFTGYLLFASALAQRGKPFAMPLDNQMTLRECSQLSEKLSNSDNVLVKMHSPLCLREHFKDKNKDVYYSVDSENFAQKSSEILFGQLKSAGFSDEAAKSVEVIPLMSKKTVVTHYESKIECSVGNFVIKASDKAVINYFLRYGIGSRKSAGFGFAELVSDGKGV